MNHKRCEITAPFFKKNSFSPKYCPKYATNKDLLSIQVFLCLLFFCVCCLKSTNLQAQNEPLSLDTIVWADQLHVPWDIEWAGEEVLFFAEIDGYISKLDLADKSVERLYEFSDVARELQVGLLGMDLHPDFPTMPHLFAAYTYYGSDETILLKIVRLTYDEVSGELGDLQVIVDNIPSKSSGTGCRILITPDEKLIASIGDLELGGTAQSWTSLNGKMLRYNLDGSIPNDNPIADSPVWTVGHRNPQGLAWGNDLLYSSEHGPSSNDELNIIEKERNYGWPEVSGPCVDETRAFCDANNVREPIAHWSPTVAPCGIAYYGEQTEFEAWQNSILMANLKAKSLIQIRLSEDGTETGEQFTYLENNVGRIRDVLVTPSGRVFVCTSNNDSFGNPDESTDQIIEIIEGDRFTGETQSLPDIPDTFTILLDSTELQVSVIAKNLKIPWDMNWGPNDEIWFNERDGHIKKMNIETGDIQTIYHIDDTYESWDNSGSHAFALHPDFPVEPYVYVSYAYNYWRNRLVRFTYDLTEQTLKDSLHLINELPGNASHNGARIVFMPDQTMLFCMGDAYQSEKAQDLDYYNGKILRLNNNGTVPDDNPFPESYVWSYGHRNPQGLVLTPSGNLYNSEHGTGNDDELNLVKRGGNHGWPEVQGFCDLSSEMAFCEANDIVEPIAAWTPTAAPGGLAYYDHPAIPEWRNSLLQCFLKAFFGEPTGQRMQILHLNEAGDEVTSTSDFFVNTFGRIRDVLVSPDGRVFIATSNRETNGNKVVRADDDKIIEIKNPAFYTDIEEPPTIPSALNVFPVPSNEIVVIEFPITDVTVGLHLYDMAGRRVDNRLVELEDDYQYFYERNALPHGTYFLRIDLPGEVPAIRRVVFN